MSRAREIYNQTVRETRAEHARQVELFMADKLDVCPCGMDMEREAIILAFDKALEGK
jgi:hypothetical protein